MRLILTLLLLSMAISIIAQPQELKYQTVRGQVTDAQSQYPLLGVTVVVMDSDPLNGSITDFDGYFKIDNVPVGAIDLKLSFVGYEDLILPNIPVSVGKQTSLKVSMEESTTMMEEVVVEGTSRTYEELNGLATLSVIGFNIAETERFAGSLGDPGRMAANFAGVSGVNDGRNDIIIRGNSPTGLLWRLEGVDIPNPNHYAGMGTTGGPVTILNNNQLSNSEFYTGAFPAMFGNANSGVFDLRLRNGNFEKREHVFQIGFNGIEAGAEGPFKKGERASYTVNYRYSVPAVMHKIGFGTGTGQAIPYYQDLTFKVNIPNKKGSFSIFGIGGLSEIDLLGSEIDSDKANDDLYGGIDIDIYNTSNTGVIGASYFHFFDENTFFRNNITLSANEFIADLDTITRDNNLTVVGIDPYVYNDYAQWTLNYTNEFNKKINSRNTVNIGSSINRINMDLTHDVYRQYDEPGTIHENGSTWLYKVYAAWSLKLREDLIVNSGMHYLNLTQNNRSWSLEPRLGIKYKINPQSSFNVAYGRHSQTQGLTVYFNETYLSDGTIRRTNTGLGLTKSDHFLAGYENSFLQDWRIKVETYYQRLFDVPVEMAPSSFSMLNMGVDFGLPTIDSLKNKGSGRNIGLELTIEKYLNDGWYLMSTSTLYDSKYKGSDGVERNTAFNGNFVTNLLTGREFSIGEYNRMIVDLRVTYAGNRRFVPIDPAASEASGSVEYNEDEAYKDRYPNYFRADIRLGYRMQMKKISQEWLLDLQNITDQKNVLYRNYSFHTHEIYDSYQLGFWPMFKYRLLF